MPKGSGSHRFPFRLSPFPSHAKNGTIGPARACPVPIPSKESFRFDYHSVTLFSGSSGNAVYFATDQGALLVDCGMSGRQVLDALCAAGLDPAGLKALLITHEHSDHVKGVGVLSRRLGLPVYATEGTWQGMDSAVGELAPQHRIVIRAGESFFLNDLEIAPFSIPHDAADPVGYRIFARDHSVAVATDLGYFSQDVRDAITGADLVLLESNHDPDLLRQNPHYPQRLKTRILGKKAT